MRVLDCTLRDGGYVNNWLFDRKMFDDIISADVSLGLDTVEIGILGKKSNDSKPIFSTQYNDLRNVPELKNDIKESINIAVMGTLDGFKASFIPSAKETSVNTLRLAFFKSDWSEAISFAQIIKERGYRIFLQAMATDTYSESELKELLKGVNEVEPDAFYVVDSFGVMFPEDVSGLALFVRENLKPSIMIGFHAHNNIQMAFANSLVFSGCMNGNCYIDASFGGMGRGAGNLNLELLLNYLATKQNMMFDFRIVTHILETHMNAEYRKNKWGYTLAYFYSSYFRVNSAYIWYLNMKGIVDESKIWQVLSKIPQENKHNLNRGIVDRIIDEMGNEVYE